MRSATTTRPPGRPQQIDGPDRRECILDAAQSLFAQQGFAATRVREVAERCQVNAALVHYYFGSKRSLLDAVMSRLLDPLVEGLARSRPNGAGLITAVVELFTTVARRQPMLPTLVFREVVLPGGEYQATFIQRYAPHLGGALPGLLQREQSAGRLKSGADLRFAALHVMALSVFPFLVRPIAAPVLGLAYDDAMVDAYRQVSVDLLEGYYRI